MKNSLLYVCSKENLVMEGTNNMLKKKPQSIIGNLYSREQNSCMSCGCPCWRSDVRYCWDCYKYQMYESK